MKNGAKGDCDPFCPVRKTMEIIQGKWTLLILRDLMAGPRRFGQLRRSLDGVSPRTLSARLKELEAEGILTRTIYAEIPPRVEYRLTPNGLGLKGVIGAMGEWGMKSARKKKPGSRGAPSLTA
ncbi:MAG: helix-turn-helix transcriptional regulator [Nitrospinae bacterium]|nr:helix-turn-helix transcriptional regulator [Nitrospinota bacterium]